MKATKKLAVLGLFALASFIPMMVLASMNAPGQVHRMPLPQRQEVLNAPAARAQEPVHVVADVTNIVVPRGVQLMHSARSRAVSAPCEDGKRWQVGALKATPEGAVGKSMVTLRCYK